MSWSTTRRRWRTGRWRSAKIDREATYSLENPGATVLIGLVCSDDSDGEEVVLQVPAGTTDERIRGAVRVAAIAFDLIRLPLP